MKLLSNQSLWIMRERDTHAHTHAGWEDEKTTRLIILRPIFITVPSVISLTDSNSPQLCVRWQMKTNYLTVSLTWRLIPCHLPEHTLIILLALEITHCSQPTNTPVCLCERACVRAWLCACVCVNVIPFVANPFVVKGLWTCKWVC